MLPPLFDSFLCKDGKEFIAAENTGVLAGLRFRNWGIGHTDREGLLDHDPYKVGMLDNNLSDSALMTSKWKARIRELMADKLSQQCSFFW